MEIRERWINLLYKSATGTKKTRNLLTPVGLFIFGIFSALFVLFAILVDKLLGLPGLLPEAVRLRGRFVEEHWELALCPDVKCKDWPNHYKCFQVSGFNKCLTYIKRKSVFPNQKIDLDNQY